MNGPRRLPVLPPAPLVGRPIDFSGAVGGPFALTVRAAPTEVTAGEPLVVTLRVVGRNAAQIPRPKWPFGDRFWVRPTDDRAFPDEQAREFDWVVVPLSSEVRRIPRLKFVYYDPDRRFTAGGFQTTYADPVPLTVRDPEPPAEPPPSRPTVPTWAWLIPPLAAAAALALWRHRRSPRVVAVRRLRRAERPEDVVRVLGEYVRAETGGPTPTTPAEFADRGAPDLAAFIARCDAARFGPEPVTADWRGEAIGLIVARRRRFGHHI